ncbi:MAG: MFS transporter [Acidimicrobiales bacterium]|nr:MFS transporter [Acidimicrobiales bacterium]MCB9393606.1 MFS transporter [Acidimicrobiaceae bacterium]
MWSTQGTPARAAGRMHETRTLQVGAFAISASFMVVFPLLPALQERAGIDTAQLGWIATAGFVAALVAQTLVAPHADRGRERLVIEGSIVVMALSTLAYALGDSVAWFIAGRLGAGLAYGAFMPAAKGLLIRRFPDAPGERIGRLHAVELAGMALGPVLAVAGKVSIGVVATIVVAAALTLAAGVPGFVAGRGTGASADRLAPAANPVAEHASLLAGLALLRHRSVLAAALVMTAYFVPIGAYDALFPRFLADIGSSDLMIGAALTAFAVPSMLLAGWAGRQVDRLGAFRAAGLGGIANIGVILLYGLVRVPVVVVVIGLFESGGQTVVGAAAAAAMGWAVPGRRAATAQGLGEAMATVAAALVAAAAAPLYARGGAAALFGVTAALTALPLWAGIRLAVGARPAEEPLVARSPVASDRFVPAGA